MPDDALVIPHQVVPCPSCCEAVPAIEAQAVLLCTCGARLRIILEAEGYIAAWEPDLAFPLSWMDGHGECDGLANKGLLDLIHRGIGK